MAPPHSVVPYAARSSSAWRVAYTATARASATASATLRRTDAWARAMWTLVVMLRNVTFAAAFAWLFAFCCSRGVVVRPPASQRHEVYVAATMAWAFALNGAINIVVHATRLAPQTFAQWPTWRPSLWYCMWRIAHGSWLTFLLGMTCSGVVGYLSGAFLSIKWQRVQLGGYFFVVVTQFYNVTTDLAARQIYQQETLAGQQKRATGTGGQPISIQQPTSLRRKLRVFLRELPTVVSIWCAGGYVQGVANLNLGSRDRMLLFLIGSVALKLSVQEVAKHYVMKSQVTQLRAMCIIIGVPTVLINTQMRIVLQNRNDSASTLLGTYLMAVFEILLRIGKVLFLKWQIAHKEVKQISKPDTTGTSPTQPDAAIFASWRKRMLALHTAESYADMYAEYIAMGCSSAIVVFFFGHPHYSFTGLSASATSDADAMNQYVLLLIQVAIELVVDFVSCVIEIIMGIEYHNVGSFGVFLGSLFTLTGGANMIITAILYIAPTPSA